MKYNPRIAATAVPEPMPQPPPADPVEEVGCELSLFGNEFTVISKTGILAEAKPSETVITIPITVPIFAVVGVPESTPVAVLNVAHIGLLMIE